LQGTTAAVLEIALAPAATDPVLFDAPGRARLDNTTVALSDVRGERGTRAEVTVQLPHRAAVGTVIVNGKLLPFTQNGNRLTVPVFFSGERFSQSEQVGSYDPEFAGGRFNGSFRIPERVMRQLRDRARAWPMTWTTEDLRTTWLAPERLLLFVQIAEPDDRWPVTLKLNGEKVGLTPAYSSIRVHRPSFVGFYADVSNLVPGRAYSLELDLPPLKPGQFQGVFFDNVETEFTDEIEEPSR
jgi:hypothetical protein